VTSVTDTSGDGANGGRALTAAEDAASARGVFGAGTVFGVRVLLDLPCACARARLRCGAGTLWRT
jgi:hypothetical protein